MLTDWIKINYSDTKAKAKVMYIKCIKCCFIGNVNDEDCCFIVNDLYYHKTSKLKSN